jgi:hypothetical protein
MTDRKTRVASNEVLFSAVNEEIERLDEQLIADAGRAFAVVCECGSLECTGQIRLPPELYAEIRARPAQFVVKPEHVIPDTERVVAEGEGYAVVEKDEPVRSALRARRDRA